MIGKLYVIRNTVNSKVYIGKTFLSLDKRFKIHKNDATKENNKSRLLYKAINSLGAENFYIELLGEYKEGLLEKKEVETIQKFNSYINGYNMTLGGDGKTYFTYSDQEVIGKYTELKTVTKTAEYFNCDVQTIRIRLKTNNIKIKTGKEHLQKFLYIPEMKRCIGDASETSRWFSNIYNCTSKSVRENIRRVQLGKRKAYHDYTFLTF